MKSRLETKKGHWKQSIEIGNIGPYGRKQTIIKLKEFDQKALLISQHKAATIRSFTESISSFFLQLWLIVYKGNMQIIVRVSFKLG